MLSRYSLRGSISASEEVKGCVGVGQRLNKAVEPLVVHWVKGKGHMPDAAVCRRGTGCRPIRNHLE